MKKPKRPRQGTRLRLRPPESLASVQKSLSRQIAALASNLRDLDRHVHSYTEDLRTGELAHPELHRLLEVAELEQSNYRNLDEGFRGLLARMTRLESSLIDLCNWLKFPPPPLPPPPPTP